MKLKDIVAMVTGAANGIGHSIALGLAREGANIIVVDIDSVQANNVANEVIAMGRRALFAKVDVSKSKEVNMMVETVLAKFSKIDILVNNAGGSARERQSLFCDSTEEVWDYVIGINLKGVFNCTKAVINHMIRRKTGKIINIASDSGLIGTYGLVYYSAAKAGIIGFTKALAKEVIRHKITVNSVAPGPIETKALTQLPSHIVDPIVESTGLGRVGKPEEIAAMVVFLSTADANFITGQIFPVCGLRNLGN